MTRSGGRTGEADGGPDEAEADVRRPGRPEVVGPTRGDHPVGGRTDAGGDDGLDGPDAASAERAASGEPVPGATPGSLRSSAMSGVRWSLIANVGKQVLRMGFFLALARIIGPHDFGIAGQASVYIAFTALLDPAGLGSAFVQRASLHERDYASMCVMTLLFGAGLIAVTLIGAAFAASFLHTPELANLLRVLTISVAVQALYVGPASVLMRNLRFGALAAADLAAGLVSTGVGLAAAALGASYWSLVFNQLALDVTFFAVVAIAAGLPRLRASVERMRDQWRYSSRVVAFQVVNYAYRNADNITIQRVVGSTALGLYSLSYRVILFPLQNFGMVVNRVAFPVYSRIQHDRPRIGRQYVLASRLIAGLAFPLMTLLLVGAPLGVDVVFGADWRGAVAPMQILALAGLPSALNTLSGPALMACGRADWLFRLGVLSAVANVVAFIVGVQWGIKGVAVGYLVVAALTAPLIAGLVGHLVHFGLAAFGRALVPSVGSSVVMGAVWVGVEHLARPLGGPGRLVVASLVAAGAYVMAMWGIWPAEARQVRSLVAEAAGRG